MAASGLRARRQDRGRAYQEVPGTQDGGLRLGRQDVHEEGDPGNIEDDVDDAIATSVSDIMTRCVRGFYQEFKLISKSFDESSFSPKSLMFKQFSSSSLSLLVLLCKVCSVTGKRLIDNPETRNH